MSKTAEQLAKELMETGDDSEIRDIGLVELLAVIEELSKMENTVADSEYHAAVEEAVSRGCVYFVQEEPTLH
jgi:hypothetical protein